jgi:hypothetical protein
VLAAVPLNANRKNGNHNGNGNGNGRRNRGSELQVEEVYNSHGVGEGPR